MDILLTLNRSYLKIALVMLFSLWQNNKDEKIRIFILSKDLSAEDFSPLKDSIMSFTVIKPDLDLSSALTTKRYPQEMYFRLFAFSFLPDDIEKILYLDPDIIVKKSLKELYSTDLGDAYVLGCTHVKQVLTRLNSMRLKEDSATAYLNTGVLLMNLALIRRDFTKEKIEAAIIDNRSRLLLPDQDVLVILFKDRIKTLDSIKYNLSDRIYSLYRLQGMKNLDFEYVKENTAIIHYCGRNKPWRESYHGVLGEFFNYYRAEAEEYFSSKTI